MPASFAASGDESGSSSDKLSANEPTATSDETSDILLADSHGDDKSRRGALCDTTLKSAVEEGRLLEDKTSCTLTHQSTATDILTDAYVGICPHGHDSIYSDVLGVFGATPFDAGAMRSLRARKERHTAGRGPVPPSEALLAEPAPPSRASIPIVPQNRFRLEKRSEPSVDDEVTDFLLQEAKLLMKSQLLAKRKKSAACGLGLSANKKKAVHLNQSAFNAILQKHCNITKLLLETSAARGEAVVSPAALGARRAEALAALKDADRQAHHRSGEMLLSAHDLNMKILAAESDAVRQHLRQKMKEKSVTADGQRRAVFTARALNSKNLASRVRSPTPKSPKALASSVSKKPKTPVSGAPKTPKTLGSGAPKTPRPSAVLLSTAAVPLLSPGWISKTFQRASGRTVGGRDTYFYSPQKQFKFRSLKNCRAFLQVLAEPGVEGDEAKALKVYRERGHRF